VTSARILGLVVALSMVLAGALFTAQGLGYVEGSSMTNNRTWSLIGPALAGLGIALAIVILQRRR
jgi:ABC-type proline/glycine betaine transport system permease subunit